MKLNLDVEIKLNLYIMLYRKEVSNMYTEKLKDLVSDFLERKEQKQESEIVIEEEQEEK